MLTLLTATMLASSFTAYPAFGDGRAAVRPLPGGSRIEAATDKGPIVEMIVRCRQGTAIISYSKLERTFCTPRLACAPSLEKVIARTCR